LKGRGSAWAAVGLCTASGFAGLAYEIVWLKQLALLFGSTVYATGATLAIFFLGMAIGSRAAAGRAASIGDPLRVYGVLELAVAASAATYFVVAPTYRAIAPSAFALVGEAGWALAFVKLMTATSILVPPAVLMGATLPVLTQFLVRERDRFARQASLLYAANTIGGAGGALVATFYLPPLLGMQATYLTAMSLSASVGLVALLMARWRRIPALEGQNIPSEPVLGATGGQQSTSAAARPVSAFLALGSGVLALALEVVWTRMFAQVLHNSVYSYTAVLVVFLAALAFGATVAHALSQRSMRPERTLRVLLVLCAIGVAGSPFLFQWITGGLDYLARGAGWTTYVGVVLMTAAAVVFVPGVLVGTVFPYSLKLAEARLQVVGETLGRLAALNTVGSIAGSLGAGFVLIPMLGTWATLRLIALSYALGAVWMSIRDESGPARGMRDALVPLLAALLITSVLDPVRLPVVRLDAERGDHLYAVDEGAYGIVSVVGREDARVIKLDNFYTIGGDASLPNDRRQANLPLFLARDPRTVFFLGLGTGVTAGSALRHDVESITVCELIPEITDAARGYFAEHTFGLFDDPRVRIVQADGREYLATRRERYDVVISDLFVPWAAGTGALYAREHYETVRDHLTDDGLFAQWLPLYQVSSREFEVIARTMLEVFPLVTLWRGDFLAGGGIAALIGHASEEPLDPELLVKGMRRLPGMGAVPEEVARAMTLLFYAGNLTAAASLFDEAPINSYDRPHIEYMAPRTQREQAAGRAQWLVDAELVALYDDLSERVPFDSDPYLSRLSDEGRSFVAAGLELQKAFIEAEAGNRVQARRHLAAFIDPIPYAVYRMLEPQLPDVRTD
jgi:spermidine synthase